MAVFSLSLSCKSKSSPLLLHALQTWPNSLVSLPLFFNLQILPLRVTWEPRRRTAQPQVRGQQLQLTARTVSGEGFDPSVQQWTVLLGNTHLTILLFLVHMPCFLIQMFLNVCRILAYSWWGQGWRGDVPFS